MLATLFNEPHYWDSPDALNLCDLTPAAIKVSADSSAQACTDQLRTFLQRWFPKVWLDSSGKERREIDAVTKARHRSKIETFEEKYANLGAASGGGTFGNMNE
jgi:hypothetical protein